MFMISVLDASPNPMRFSALMRPPMLRRLLPRTAVFGAMLVAPRLVQAATYYTAPDGKPDALGSEDSPWDIPTAVAAAGPGDIVLLKDGLYFDQSLYVTRSGMPGAPITFRAADGALPILEGDLNNPYTGDGITPVGDGIGAKAQVHDIVFEGIMVRKWRWAGVTLSWMFAGLDSIVVRYCAADENQLTGIAFFRASNVTIEHSLASRNGWGPDSWSSNINLYGMQGSGNVVRGNVSFHGIDTSDERSDGNGIILDVSIDQGSALIENNVAFLNGGACIAVTDTSNARIVNNSCYHNVQFGSAVQAELNLSDTCRTDVTGIPVNGGSWSLHNVTLRNNVAVADAGKPTTKLWECNNNTSWVNSTVASNLLTSGTGADVFANPAKLDLHPASNSALLGASTGADLFPTDNGFDPRCLKKESGQRVSWWTYAPDESYIRSIGGIKSCFHPQARPTTNPAAIGAYEPAAPIATGGRPGSGGSTGTGGVVGTGGANVPVADSGGTRTGGAAGSITTGGSAAGGTFALGGSAGTGGVALTGGARATGGGAGSNTSAPGTGGTFVIRDAAAGDTAKSPLGGSGGSTSTVSKQAGGVTGNHDSTAGGTNTTGTIMPEGQGGGELRLGAGGQPTTDGTSMATGGTAQTGGALGHGGEPRASSGCSCRMATTGGGRSTGAFVIACVLILGVRRTRASRGSRSRPSRTAAARREKNSTIPCGSETVS